METLDNHGLKAVALGCKYDREWIFKDLTFFVKPREALGIVGPSGSGKTTLAYCLTGIIPKNLKGEVTGGVYVDGKNILELDDKERYKIVNVVLQNYEVQIFGLTVEEDLLFVLDNLELNEKEAEKRLELALECFGLKEYRNYQVNELSGGLRQKLALASTLLMQPKYLVMDDPMANLDWRGIVELRRTLQMLKESGHGLVIMSRRLKGLEPVIDKTIVLGQKLAQQGIPDEAMDESDLTFIKDDPVIKFENVWFKYAKRMVLKGINLSIGRGQCVVLMGPNGSGKTTLAKHINGLLKPSSGRVLVLGKDTKTHGPAQMARHVGFVFQDPDRHITQESVWDEVIFGAKNLGLSYSYAEMALEALGLNHRKNEPPYRLSMGERIRLSIAGILAMNPEILILDEPTTGQDEETLSIISSMLIRMKAEGKTVLVITHDSDFALKIGDRITVIYDGNVVADGQPKRILFDRNLLEEFGLEPPSHLLIQYAKEAS
ncbi:MAG: ABC transporter ATP-binding protein [Nitrososphaerota archaeon]